MITMYKKRFIQYLLVAFTLGLMVSTLCSYFSPHSNALYPEQSAIQAEKVYITATGQCYHSKNCIYTTYGSTEITLAEAEERGLRPCSYCQGNRDE